MKGVPAKSCPSCAEQYDADVLFCPRDGTPLASARNPSLGGADRDAYLGIELPGQIRLDHLIGIGSMGRVYRAFQGGIERDVAVKVLHRELSGNAELTARFHREAKVASRLVHPNVVQVLMTGALPPRDATVGGELYLVMEYLDGISLLSALAAAGTSGEGQALPLPRALHIALQVCDAAGEAHAQGIVHRDLKPENVMLVRRGDDPDYVKVLDFGIARLEWADRALATQAGLIFGTAKYISPEGAEGQPVGPPADVYSIATMLYQMLAGRTPFEGESPVALLVQHTHAPPPPLKSIARASYVPEPLAAAIMQNLSKKAAERAPNARAFGRDLIAAARAGGLFPEEIATQSTLLSPASMGAVKLASKERTRSHELSAELAGKIGGVAAVPAPSPSSPSMTPAPSASSPSRTPTPATVADQPAAAIEAAPLRTPTPPPMPALPAGAVSMSATIPAEPSREATLFTPTSSRTEVPSAPISRPEALRVSPGDTHIDLDVTGHPDVIIESQKGAEPKGAASLQGTDANLVRNDAAAPKRARFTRLAAILACALAAVPIAVVGGKRFTSGSSAQADTVESAIDDARDCMRRRAWDAPPTHNFKAITDEALKRWPGSAAVIELRREAASKLVTEALGRKYAGDSVEATHLVELALELDPSLTTAQHLAADLASARAPDVAPAASSSAPPSDKGPRTVRRPVPPPSSANKVDPRDARGPKPPSTGGAVLPPPPAPKPSDRPPPAATGPWL